LQRIAGAQYASMLERERNDEGVLQLWPFLFLYASQLSACAAALLREGDIGLKNVVMEPNEQLHELLEECG